MKEGWEYKKLEEICSKGSSNISLNKIEDNYGEYNLYGASGLVKGIDFYHQEKAYIGIVKDGSGVGRVDIYPPKSSLVGTMQYIFPKDGCEIGFLKYLLQGLHLENYKTGAAIPHIYFKDYGKTKVLLPPLSEQLHIVEELDLLSSIIEKKKAQLNELDNLAQSLFYEMFGDPITNEKGWKVKNLGEICEIVRGGSPRPIDKFLGGNIPWIKIGDATKGDDIYLNSTKEHIIEEGLKKTRYIPKGSLIFANCGVSLGFARIIQFDGCIHDGWLALMNINENKINKVFLLKSLNFCTTYFRKLAPDGTQPNLNTSIMKLHKQILPPITLQDTYVVRLRRIEHQKTLIQKSIEQVETLFNSRMDYYFN